MRFDVIGLSHREYTRVYFVQKRVTMRLATYLKVDRLNKLIFKGICVRTYPPE